MRRGKEMSMAETHPRQVDNPYIAGRRDGLGIAAIVIGIVTFLSLLGAEKAIVAIILGSLAMRGAEQGSRARRQGIAAIILGTVFMVTVPILLVVFREQLATLIAALEKLS
jgi:Na+-driven multidrug efflux pump